LSNTRRLKGGEKMPIKIKDVYLGGLFVTSLVEVNGQRAVPGTSRWMVNGKPVSRSLSDQIDRALKEHQRRLTQKIFHRCIVTQTRR